MLAVYYDKSFYIIGGINWEY